MFVSKAKARRAAVFFLTLLGGAFLALLAHTIYLKVGPRCVEVVTVPFGLPGGTRLLWGDTPDSLAGMEMMPLTTQQELRRAADLQKSGRYEDAAEVYEAIALQYPGAFVAEWGVVNSLLSLNVDSLQPIWRSQLDVMEKILRRRYPESSVSFYMDARLADKANSSSTALELARVATQKAPAFAEARLLYADLLFKSGRYAESAQEARTAISLWKGDDSRAYFRLAQVYHDEGRLDSCELIVEYALSQFPVDVDLLCLQGMLQEYDGHFDSAEATYRRALAIRPGYAFATEALLSLGQKSTPGTSGVSLSPQERAQVAYDILEPLVQQYPENLPLREALGKAYLKGRDFERAKLQFLEIQNRDAAYPEIAIRIQEASAAPSVRETKKSLLVDDLSRAIDSMRTLPISEHSFESSLGHYLVRYGATEKEFFKRYSAANFKKIGKSAWQEKFFEAPYFHRYTALFDEKGKFYGVHVVVTDSNVLLNSKESKTPEIYTSLFQHNTRLSGVGSETGETDCDGTVMSGAIWETRDNFELLARIVGKPEEVRMIRLDKAKIPEGTRLCDYLKYLSLY